MSKETPYQKPPSLKSFYIGLVVFAVLYAIAPPPVPVSTPFWWLCLLIAVAYWFVLTLANSERRRPVLNSVAFTILLLLLVIGLPAAYDALQIARGHGHPSWFRFLMLWIHPSFFAVGVLMIGSLLVYLPTRGFLLLRRVSQRRTVLPSPSEEDSSSPLPAIAVETEGLSDRTCPTCGKPLRRLQVETMIGNEQYQPWCREGYCSLRCHEQSRRTTTTTDERPPPSEREN